jgi:hypothetical protein
LVDPARAAFTTSSTEFKRAQSSIDIISSSDSDALPASQSRRAGQIA